MSNQNTKKIKSKSRRRFLVRGGLGTLGVLALGTYVFRNPLRRKVLEMAETLVPPYAGSGTEANMWFEVLKDNNVLIHSSKVEMGQGTFTGLVQIVADELDMNIDQIQIKAAETASGVVDAMSTGGSLSIASLWMPLREMAATMREMIKIQAAKKWNVEVSAIGTSEGMLSANGKSMRYADAAADVIQWEIPDTPELRPVEKMKYVGKPIPRVDQKAKVLGDPIFGMDASMEGMLHATIVRPEHIGSSIKSADYSAAESMPGVVKIVEQDGWIGVIANSFPEALAAKSKIKVEWDIPKVWTEEELRSFLKVGEGNKMVTQKIGDGIKDEDENVVTMEFSSPIGAHAQIEPNGAVAFVDGDRVTIKLSTQVPGATQNSVAKALGFEKENVNVISTYLGGGFGRRLNTNHAIQAAQLSMSVGKPVKYFFTRKEEFQNDTFRPPTHHVMKGRLDENNNLVAFEHHYASGDVAAKSLITPPGLMTIMGADFGAHRGANIMYDKIPNHRTVQWHKSLPFATSWWRSLGLLANTFAIESFMDEMAIAAGKNPAQFRLDLLSDDNPYAKRTKKVIELAVEKGSYKDGADGNRAMGFAASIDAGSPCAHVVEVSVEGTKIKVEKVTVAFDCGLAVNPDQVKAQCEGCVIMGLSATLYEQMTIKDGRLYPIIYGAYDMALMKDSPKEIDVYLTQGTDAPGPVGEPPLGPIGAAIANAVKRITGKRLTDLPLSLA